MARIVSRDGKDYCLDSNEYMENIREHIETRHADLNQGVNYRREFFFFFLASAKRSRFFNVLWVFVQALSIVLIDAGNF
jgi:hypothetical protein